MYIDWCTAVFLQNDTKIVLLLSSENNRKAIVGFIETLHIVTKLQTNNNGTIVMCDKGLYPSSFMDYTGRSSPVSTCMFYTPSVHALGHPCI